MKLFAPAALVPLFVTLASAQGYGFQAVCPSKDGVNETLSNGQIVTYHCNHRYQGNQFIDRDNIPSVPECVSRCQSVPDCIGGHWNSNNRRCVLYGPGSDDFQDLRGAVAFALYNATAENCDVFKAQVDDISAKLNETTAKLEECEGAFKNATIALDEATAEAKECKGNRGHLGESNAFIAYPSKGAWGDARAAGQDFLIYVGGHHPKLSADFKNQAADPNKNYSPYECGEACARIPGCKTATWSVPGVCKLSKERGSGSVSAKDDKFITLIKH